MNTIEEKKAVAAPDKNDDDFIMSPKVDYTFKELMKNEKVRKGFISAVLGISPDMIKKTVVINTETGKKHKDEKLCILDVRVTMNDDTEINMEMQVWYMTKYADRNVLYIAKMLAGQTNINKAYSNVKKCISISVLNHNYLDRDFRYPNKYHSVFHFSEDSTREIYSDRIECHVVELKKLPPEDDGTELYYWAKFFSSEKREELKMYAEKNEYIDEAYRELDMMSNDRAKRIAYEEYEMAMMDYNTMREEQFELGYDKGTEEERKKTEEQKKIAEEQKKRAEEQKKIAEEQKKRADSAEKEIELLRTEIARLKGEK